MPKDSIIENRILDYLYICLRQGAAPEPHAYGAKALGITQKRWEGIIRSMAARDLISGVSFVPVLGSLYPGLRISDPCITTKGISYLGELTGN